MKTPATPNTKSAHSSADLAVLLNAVSHVVGQYPSGTLCLPSDNALHQIIEEIPASLDLMHGMLLAIVPPLSSKMERVPSLPLVAWHFTDEDGHTHITVSGTAEIINDTAEVAALAMSAAHHALIVESPDRYLSRHLLATRIHNIRFEVPSRDVNILIELQALPEPDAPVAVALAS